MFNQASSPPSSVWTLKVMCSHGENEFLMTRITSPSCFLCPICCMYTENTLLLTQFIQKTFCSLLWLESFQSLTSITIHLQSHMAAYIKTSFKTSDEICRLSGDLSRKVKHQSGKRVLARGAHLRFPPRHKQTDWIFWWSASPAYRWLQ